jgi:hypothetical protein
LIFLDRLRLFHPRDAHALLDIRHIPGRFLEKARRITEMVPFDGLFRGRLRGMKMVLDSPYDSAITFLNGLFLSHIKGRQLKSAF